MMMMMMMMHIMYVLATTTNALCSPPSNVDEIKTMAKKNQPPVSQVEIVDDFEQCD